MAAADFAGEVGKLALLAIGVREAAIGRRRLDLRRTIGQCAQSGPQRGRESDNFRQTLEEGRQVAQGGLCLLQFRSKLIERIVRIPIHDLVQFRSQRAERSVGLDQFGDDLRGLGSLHERGVNPAQPGGQAGDDWPQPLDVGYKSRNVAIEPELSGNFLPLPVQLVEFLVFLLQRGKHLRPARTNDMGAEIIGNV